MVNSFNEWDFGGAGQTANAKGIWLLNEDNAGTVIDDLTNYDDGDLEGGNDTQTLQANDGPTGWLPDNFDLGLGGGGNNIRINEGDGAVYGGSELTMFAWVRGSDAGSIIGRWYNSSTTYRSALLNIQGGTSYPVFNARINSTDKNVVGSTAMDTNWRFVVASYDGANMRLYVDGVEEGTAAAATGAISYSDGNGVDDYIGSHATNWNTQGNKYGGELAFVGRLNVGLTSAEVTQLKNGPEPVYSSGVSFADSGAFNVGTWGLPSQWSGTNGTITYEVIAVDADGNVLDSTTGDTGTLDIRNAAGDTAYLLVRASNTGGYDVGDYSTRTSAYGSANDGYYEIASVTAATTDVVVFESISTIASGSDDSIETTAPAGVVSGDLLVLFATSGAGNYVTPTGWTQLNSWSTWFGTRHHILYWRIADGGANDTPTISVDTGNWRAVMYRISGHDPTTPIDTYWNNGGENSTDPYTLNDVTISNDNSLLLLGSDGLGPNEPGPDLTSYGYFKRIELGSTDPAAFYSGVFDASTDGGATVDFGNSVRAGNFVVAIAPAAGGGGSSIPVFMHHYKLLRG